MDFADTPTLTRIRNRIELPYPGLRPFQPGDSEYFFGREEQVRDIVARLRQQRFVAVIGGSGCGKSSLVLAGAIPRLRSFALEEAGDFWVAVVATPGTNHPDGDSPLWRLARKFCALLRPDASGADGDTARLADCVEALRRPGGFGRIVERYGTLLADDDGVDLNAQPPNFLILVDQFEELFHPSNVAPLVAADCEHLVMRIVEQVDPKRRHARVCLALTMRSEHLNDCPRYNDLPDAINGAFFLVKRPDARQLRQAIEAPALRFLRNCISADRKRDWPKSIDFEAGLVDRLLADSERVLAQLDHADQLPLLQHLLFWIWTEACKRCEDQPLPDRLSLGDLAEAVAPGLPLSPAVNTLEACLEYRCEAVFASNPARQDGWAVAFQGLAFKDPNTGNYTQQREPRLPLSQRLRLGGESDAALHEYMARWLFPHRYLHWDSNSTTVKVAHETLIRRWQRFRGWIDRQAAQFVLYRRLLDDTDRWLIFDRSPHFLSGGASLTNYEENDLAAALEDPVQLARIERLMRMSRDAACRATPALALEFLRESIEDRRREREAEERQLQEAARGREEMAEARRNAEVAEARSKQAESEVALGESKRLLAYARVRSARQRANIALLAIVFIAPLLLGTALVALGERELSDKERLLHAGYALAAETSGNATPQFRNFEQMQVVLRNALIGAHFFRRGRDLDIGIAGIWPLSLAYGQRPDALSKAQMLSESRTVGALLGVLQGAAWRLPTSAAAPAEAVSEQAAASLSCIDVQPLIDLADTTMAPRFLPHSSAEPGSGLLIAQNLDRGTSIYAAKRLDNGVCLRGAPVISFPPQAVAIKMTSDLSNFVVSLENRDTGQSAPQFSTQFYALHWLDPNGVHARLRASVAEKLDLPAASWVLPSRRSPFATDVKLGDHVYRFFDVEAAPIAPPADNIAAMVPAAADSICGDFQAIAEEGRSADRYFKVWSAPAPPSANSNASRAYCLSVVKTGSGIERYLATLYRFRSREEARQNDRHLSLVADIELGGAAPTAFKIDPAGPLAFETGAGWRALPWRLSSLRTLAAPVFDPAVANAVLARGELPVQRRTAELITKDIGPFTDADLTRNRSDKP